MPPKKTTKKTKASGPKKTTAQKVVTPATKPVTPQVPLTPMFKFAHMADLHMGAHGDPVLRKMELATLTKAVNICIAERVAFILIAGDIFDSNLPNLEAVNDAVKEFKRVRDQGIPLYYIYGSHDYSANQTSMVNILETAGLFIRVSHIKAQIGDDINAKIQLEFVEDPLTKAKIVGVSGRMSGNEKEVFDHLDYDQLEKEPGFKIFMFHTAFTELKPANLASMESIPLTDLPRNFAYYAGGHVHKKIQHRDSNYENLTYPGPLFAGRPKDLEDTAKGEDRGFFIVDVGQTPTGELKVSDYHYESTQIFEYALIEENANKKTASAVSDNLLQQCRTLDVKGKIVVMRVFGELASGKTSDINFNAMREVLLERGAEYISLNRYSLHTKEMEILVQASAKKEEVEENLFLDNVDKITVIDPLLKGKKGAKLAMQLLDALRNPKQDNENAGTYEERISEDAQNVLKLKEVLE